MTAYSESTGANLCPSGCASFRGYCIHRIQGGVAENSHLSPVPARGAGGNLERKILVLQPGEDEE